MSLVGFEPSGLEFDPFLEFRRMTKTMNRLLSGDIGDVGRGGEQGGGGLLTTPLLGGLITPPERQWVPLVDVRETDKEIIVHAELPGVKKEEVKLEVRDNRLIVSGERKQERKEEGERFHRIERTYGKFLRMLALPSGVDPSNICANFENGVLEVVVPKPDTGGKPTTIDIGLKSDQPKLSSGAGLDTGAGTGTGKGAGIGAGMSKGAGISTGTGVGQGGGVPTTGAGTGTGVSKGAGLSTGTGVGEGGGVPTTSTCKVGERRGEKEGERERTGYGEGQTGETGSSRVSVGEAGQSGSKFSSQIGK